MMARLPINIYAGGAILPRNFAFQLSNGRFKFNF